MRAGLRCNSLALCLALAHVPSSLAAAPPAAAFEAQQPGPPAAAAESGGGSAMGPARLQGSAESAVVDWVLANSGPLVRDMHAGGFRVAYTVTPAEGWWDKAGEGKLAWHEAPANHVHLRIFVADLSDGRLVPGLTVAATLIDANGNEQAVPTAFGWYPLINAYGGNLPLLADGSYRLRVRIVAPMLSSDGRMARGEELGRITQAEFPAVTISQNEVMLLRLATETDFSTVAEQLKPCNAALSAAISALWHQSVSGAEKSDGDYFVSYALGDTASATPLTRLRQKGLREFGSKESTRLEVLVRDSRTGRLIPSLAPQASVEDAGDLYDRGELTPMRHPWLYLYGRNLRIPRRGIYRLRVSVEAPGFRRWGRQSERFALPAAVEFDNLSLKPQGQKPDLPKDAPTPDGKPESGTHP